MTDPINVALVGCGYWGPNLLRNLMALPECRVTLACDRDEERLRYIRGLYPELAVTAEFQKVLENGDVDAVVIATPVSSHFPLAKASLHSGKHTFIEKPMARTVAECRELVSEAEAGSLTLMIGHTFVYHPAVRKIKEIIDSGDVGDIMYISSRRLNLGLFQRDINVAWDLAPHDVSLILYLSGKDPTSVNCQGKAHVNPRVVDVANVSLNFASGLFAVIQSSWIDPKKVRETTIVGSRKMIIYDDIEPLEKIKIYDKHVKVPPHYDTFAEFQYSYHYGDAYVPYLKHVEPLRSECTEFIRCIREGDTPESDGIMGERVIRVLEAVDCSLDADGSRVYLSPERDDREAVPPCSGSQTM